MILKVDPSFNISYLLLSGRLVSTERGELGEGGDEERELLGRERGEDGGVEIGGQATENAGEPVDLLSRELWPDGRGPGGE